MKRLLKRMLSAAGLRSTELDRWRQAADLEAVPLPAARDAHGLLRVWASDDAAAGSEGGAPMRTSWVPGPDYDGMRNNDLRGYLDGRFQYAWNQVGQAHVRVGRLAGWVAYGEHELFRVLHRWSGVTLPPGARVRSAELVLGVEAGPPVPLTLHLYPVLRDWSPGSGGRLRDNVSPPAEGEVWWNEAEHGSSEWGLPGAGFAADSGGPDTAPEPLASVQFAPGDSSVAFRSPELARYCGSGARGGDPLRFLIKLADVHEDVPGALLTLYAADQGDDRTLTRRPRLTLEWDAPGRVLLTRPVRLEHGRAVELEPVAVPGGGWRWAEFVPEAGSGPLRIERRLHGSDERWQPVSHPFEGEPGPMRLRIRALVNPVEWGTPFKATVRDTWVRSAPASQQSVPFRFTSPTGIEHRVDASFQGDATWTASFEPDEVGPWSYRWSHTLAEAPYESAEGAFDVVVSSRAQALDALARLAERARRLGVRGEPVLGRRILVAFSRIERAAMALETPETWRSPAFLPVARALDDTRKALWGIDVPAELPMNPCPPPSWAHAPADDGTELDSGSSPAGAEDA